MTANKVELVKGFKRYVFNLCKRKTEGELTGNKIEIYTSKGFFESSITIVPSNEQNLGSTMTAGSFVSQQAPFP